MEETKLLGQEHLAWAIVFHLTSRGQFLRFSLSHCHYDLAPNYSVLIPLSCTKKGENVTTHVRVHPRSMDMLTPIFQIILKKPHRRTSSGGFHWTKDGTKIAFISTNWSQVDEFTASKYHVYPYGEKLRQTPQMYKHFYPMPGRPAPKLKLNLVQLPQGSLAHIKPPKELDGQVK